MSDFRPSRLVQNGYILYGNFSPPCRKNTTHTRDRSTNRAQRCLSCQIGQVGTKSLAKMTFLKAKKFKMSELSKSTFSRASAPTNVIERSKNDQEQSCSPR